MTSISVVMATYNGERFLREQLESIARQTLLPDELCIADDGSSDSSLALIEAFAATVPFPVRIHQNPERLGYAENFLRASLRANSELLAFCDQDDIWDASKLASVVAEFENPDVVMCAHQADLIDTDGKFIAHFSQGIARSCTVPALSLDPWGIFLGFSMTIRRSLLDRIPLSERGPDSHEPHKAAAHDRWAYTLANACGDTALIARPLALYRQHQRNQFGKQKARRLRRVTLPLAHITEKGEAYVAIATHRAQLFQRASDAALDPTLKARWLAASRLWLELSGSSARRAAVYREPGRLKRIALLADNLRASVYRPPPSNRFVFGALLKDALTVIK